MNFAKGSDHWGFHGDESFVLILFVPRFLLSFSDYFPSHLFFKRMLNLSLTFTTFRRTHLPSVLSFSPENLTLSNRVPVLLYGNHRRRQFTFFSRLCVLLREYFVEISIFFLLPTAKSLSLLAHSEFSGPLPASWTICFASNDDSSAT